MDRMVSTRLSAIVHCTRRRNQRGAALVEFAIILPVLLIFLLGIIDLGRVFYTYEALANAAREGARYCALHPGDDVGTVARVREEINTSDTTFIVLDTSVTSCPNVSGPVEVRVGSNFDLVTPLIADVVGDGTLWLETSASMVVWR